MNTPHPPELTEAEIKRLACLDMQHNYCASICIRADDGRSYSFATSHYLDAIHEANAGRETNAPSECLVLRFTTGEVTLRGFRLDRIEDALADGHLRRLKTVHSRYAGVLKTGPLILSITVNRKNEV